MNEAHNKSHDLRDADGRFASALKCHCCGKSISNNNLDTYTDEDVLGHPLNSGDDGFLMCGSTKRCQSVWEWTEEQRVRHYQAQRAENRTAVAEGRRVKCLIAASKKSH